MSMICLAVTEGVLCQEHVDGPGARQFAIKDASKDIQHAVETASKENMVAILLADRFRVLVGDTDAIWRAHNPLTCREFDLLLDLLALRPGLPMQFNCELEDSAKI